MSHFGLPSPKKIDRNNVIISKMSHLILKLIYLSQLKKGHIFIAKNTLCIGVKKVRLAAKFFSSRGPRKANNESLSTTAISTDIYSVMKIDICAENGPGPPAPLYQLLSY